MGIRKKNGMPDRAPGLREDEDRRLCPARALFRAFSPHGRLKERRNGASSVNRLVEKAAEQADVDPEKWTPSQLQKALTPSGSP